MRRTRRAAAVTASAIIGLALIVPVSPAAAAAPPPWQVVATGLDNPRQLTYSSGDLYVTEAGRGGDGPCVYKPEMDADFCYGASGAVTLVDDSGTDVEVISGLPSITSFSAANPMGDTTGPSDIAFIGTRKYVLSIGLGGSDEFRAEFGDVGKLLGTLVTGKLGNPGVTLFADVVAYEAQENPAGDDIDSNPVGILRQGSAYQVADAGANAVVRAAHQGTFSTTAVFDPVLMTTPPPPGLPPVFPADAVPTAVVEGPDHALYVSQLTGFPFQPGKANIYRVVDGQRPAVYASGLTNLTDLAFARDGSLYAVQLAANGLLNGPIGSLVKVTPGGSSHQTVAGGLFAPYGVAIVKDAAYVSTCSVCPGTGEVIKIPLG